LNQTVDVIQIAIESNRDLILPITDIKHIISES